MEISIFTKYHISAGDCRSLWLSQLSEGYRGGLGAGSTSATIVTRLTRYRSLETCNGHFQSSLKCKMSKFNLARNIKLCFPSGNFSLYGGDIATILDLMETSIKNLQLQGSSTLYRQDARKLKVIKTFTGVISALEASPAETTFNIIHSLWCFYLRTCVKATLINYFFLQNAKNYLLYILQVLENFSFILSHLLQDDQMQSWLDLSSVEFEFLRTRFIRQ